jgi:Spy/CpxP family protein refolding chaperone
MKRLFTMLLFASVISVSASAQDQGANNDKKEHHKQKIAEKLELNDEQKARAESVHSSFRDEMNKLKAENGLSDEEKKKRKMELRKKHNQDFESILNDKQKEQWKELRKERKDHAKDKAYKKHGRHGKHNKHDKFKQLNLTEEQSAKMKEVRSSMREQALKIRNDSSLDESAKRAKMKELKEKHFKNLKDVLTPEQMEKLKKENKQNKQS